MKDNEVKAGDLALHPLWMLGAPERGQGILGTSRKIASFHKEEGGDQERERDILKFSGL